MASAVGINSIAQQILDCLMPVWNVDNSVKEGGFCKCSPQEKNIILIVVRDQNDFRIVHRVANSPKPLGSYFIPVID